MSDNLSPGVINSVIQRTVEEIQSVIAPIVQNLSIRQIVKEEIEKKLKPLNNGKFNSGASIIPRLELCFSCDVSETVWTAEPIKGEGNSSIFVSLFDPQYKETVKSGPLASAKVEVVVLKGCFDSDDWTTEEFDQNVIMEMNGKNILKGNAFLKLNKGIGALGDLSFVHNKNWKSVTKLRLGAKLVDSFQNIRVVEAKTKTFTMKDQRMKANRKGVEVLSLKDKIWCLKNIGQRGPIVDRLTEKGIETVKDFLSLHFVHPEELQKILGRGWSDKKLKATIGHALKCKKPEKRYLASHPTSQENYIVVSTEVFNVLGIFKGSQFIPFDQLSETLKCDAYNRVKYAFDNKEEGVVKYAFNNKEGVVWDESSPTYSSNGPFSSMMGENVASEATDGASVSGGNASSVLDIIPLLSSHGLDNGGRISSDDPNGFIWKYIPPSISPTSSCNGPFCSMMVEDVASETVDGVSNLSGEVEVYRNACSVLDKSDDPNNILSLLDMMDSNGVSLRYDLRVPSFNNEDQMYL